MTDEQRSGQTGDEELVASNPNANGPDGAAGGMGVSSERTGPTGPGQHGTDGQLDTAPPAQAADEAAEQAVADPSDLPAEQTADDGRPDVNPDFPGPPKSGYSSRDPRSQDAPYQPGQERGR